MTEAANLLGAGAQGAAHFRQLFLVVDLGDNVSVAHDAVSTAGRTKGGADELVTTLTRQITAAQGVILGHLNAARAANETIRSYNAIQSGAQNAAALANRPVSSSRARLPRSAKKKVASKKKKLSADEAAKKKLEDEVNR